MKKLALKTCVALGLMSLASPALAYDYVKVNDASQIKFIISGDRVFLRNIHEFDANWLTCCYNYWLDLTTETGKAQYAYFMLRYASKESVDFLVLDRSQPSEMYHVGNFL